MRSNWPTLSLTDRREAIVNIEKQFKNVDSEDHVEIPPEHVHAGGVYARIIDIPAGVALVGEIHKEDQINVVLSGEILVFTEVGSRVCKAGDYFISEAGCKRVGVTLRKTKWMVLHGTDETEVDKIRENFISPSYDEFDKSRETDYVLGSSSSSSISSDRGR